MNDRLRKIDSWLFGVVLAIYFAINIATISVVGLAVVWYVQSMRPVVDWIDPDGPGYRVMEATADHVTVRWIALRLLLDCPGRTEVSIIGEIPSYIESYPFLIERERRTLERRYVFREPLPPGAYQVRIVDIARCNPLFENRQVLRVPFEVPAR